MSPESTCYLGHRPVRFNEGYSEEPVLGCVFLLIWTISALKHTGSPDQVYNEAVTPSSESMDVILELSFREEGESRDRSASQDQSLIMAVRQKSVRCAGRLQIHRRYCQEAHHLWGKTDPKSQCYMVVHTW